MPIISKDVIINEHIYGYTMTRVDKIDPPIEDVDKEWSQAVLVTPAGDSLPSSEGGNVVDVVDNALDATESAIEQNADPDDAADISVSADESSLLQAPVTQPAISVEPVPPAQTTKRKRNQSTDPPAFKQTTHAEEPSHRYASMRPHRSAKDRDWTHGNWKVKMSQLDDGSASNDDDDDADYWKEMYMSNIKRLMDAYDEGFDEAEVLLYRVHVTHKLLCRW